MFDEVQNRYYTFLINFKYIVYLMAILQNFLEVIFGFISPKIISKNVFSLQKNILSKKKKKKWLPIRTLLNWL